MTFSHEVLDMGSGASANQPLFAYNPSPVWTLGKIRASSELNDNCGAANFPTLSTSNLIFFAALEVSARTPSANHAAKAESELFFASRLKVSRTRA